MPDDLEIPTLADFADHNSADLLANSKDFDECILRIGSFLSIIQCKKLSPIQLFVIIAQSEDLQKIVLEMLGFDTFGQFIKEYAVRYPIICKSKIVITKLAAKRKHAEFQAKRNI